MAKSATRLAADRIRDQIDDVSEHLSPEAYVRFIEYILTDLSIAHKGARYRLTHIKHRTQGQEALARESRGAEEQGICTEGAKEVRTNREAEGG